MTPSVSPTDRGPGTEHTNATPHDAARRAGVGGLAVLSAKIYFLLAGLVQQALLPRLLGLDGYGALASALSLASIAYNPLVSTGIQGVSRAVAAAPPTSAPTVLRQSLLVHAAFAIVLAAAAFALSPAAALALGAPHLTAPLRIMSGVLLAYGLYAPLIGALNGERRLVAQALFDIGAATVRTGSIVVGAVLAARSAGGLSPHADGPCFGALFGAVAVLLAAWFVVGTGRPGAPGAGLRAHAAFVAPLLVAQALLNLLLQADLTLLRRFAADAARAAGAAATAADGYVGAYRATQLFSFLPFQILVAVTFVLFPMLAHARHDRERDTVAGYVENGLRIALIVAGGMVSVTAGLSGGLLRLVIGESAASLGATALGILALGFGAFAIFSLLTAVLNGLGHERASLVITFLAFALVVASCFGWVRGTPLGEGLLVRTALCTSAGIALATLLACAYTRHVVGSLVPARVFGRVALAFGAALGVARNLPAGSVWLVVPEAALVVGVYALVLVVSRELGPSDLAYARRILKRRA
ncbi:MAG TPA: lipopolysaccharide biosynthesis protein [Polyangiaceae bacterium]|nr:lipopolysaccharide biosynthesis protein [Polyangiaceae bacterium]